MKPVRFDGDFSFDDDRLTFDQAYYPSLNPPPIQVLYETDRVRVILNPHMRVTYLEPDEL